TDVVINSAGLRAQEMSGMLGVDIRQENSDVRYYKGEYFSISNRHRGKVKRLIYPVPNPLSLGLHTVVRLDGTLKLGPNAFPVEDIDYDVDESHKEEFLHESKKYMPFIEDDDLSPDMSGIRPKLFHGEEVARDFMICHEKKKGCPNFINLIGIESPGFTAAPAIARYVRKIVKDEFL
ncbi:MAG: FAD-dependent oxidoreductase, partial [Candidatus Aureabacteria bacterium]|nr:FAD-dependent oxidoreductase [Candidatus Auribacterota bacterium]